MTHLVWGSSLSGRDLNWNRRFLIKIGIPNNLPSTQTGNSRWETASLPTPHLPETRIKRSLVLVWQCVTSFHAAPWHPIELNGTDPGKRKMKMLLDWCHGYLWKPRSRKSICSARSVCQAQVATRAPLPSSAFSSARTSSFSLIYCSPPEHPSPIEPLIVSSCWYISAEASIAWEASTCHLMKFRLALHTS